METGVARRKWSRLVAEWKRSGLTARQFAAKRKIAASTLSWWAWRLRAEEGSREREATDRLGFVSVALDDGPTGQAAWELSTPAGVVLRVHRPLDEASLRTVLAVLVPTQRAS